MRKLWSFFWWVVAVCVAATIIASFIEPYLWLFGLLLVLAVAAVGGFKLWRTFRGGRRDF